jgi:hypothetical protein
MSPIGGLFLSVVKFNRSGEITSETIRILRKMSGQSRLWCDKLLAMSHPSRFR